MLQCSLCGSRPAVVRRSASGEPNCKDCFIDSFESDVYDYIRDKKLIEDGDKVCIGVSGGKDSSVLLHVLWSLQRRFQCNWELCLLAIDEGIKGYRDHSLTVVDAIQARYGLELKILNFMDAFGYSMDKVVGLIGKKNNCTVCGTFRRQMLEVGARLLRANVLCTGHNADDMAETVLLNIFRGDVYKLAKASQLKDGLPGEAPDGADTEHCSERSQKTGTPFRRIKPLLYSFEKEIVLYARFQSLDYFSTECIYSPEAYRGYMRTFIKNLELIEPRIILNIIKAGSMLYADYAPIDGSKGVCVDCGVVGVKDLCKACSIVRKLDTLVGETGNTNDGCAQKPAKAILSDRGFKLNYD
ncbi:hypothetical protein BEWA_027520 [Theileria equi strain WA]|uniref:Cytoplasmic tRNA 2-thiolation protein 1 n=1 Tax=Theileria equi strain WA TaxID=1537102 RepID=L0AXE9_THEEQ|nr:hypothetical protein BEWA_027520 [Theileria equi strain WA]AFZ79903.1 hypothetical protein BEWA_027520 [Theileria equi strain WA]|eukprot:XP_004829569.1 hypothetical protein BEWA_027520 [Theileria equi strain WA]